MANPSRIIPNDHWAVESFRRLSQWEFFPITILIIINLIIGLMTNHYGTGWDDFPFTFPYGENSLSSYRTLLIDHSSNFYCSYLISKDCYYGPIYFVLVTMVANLAQNLSPAIKIPDIWHAMNFLVLNVGIISLYALSRLWLSKWTSFSIAVLFAVQPLLRGHGFINPKDMPFMVFFLSSITTGLIMVETFTGENDEHQWDINCKRSLEDVWRMLGLTYNRKKRILLGFLASFMILFMLIVVFLPGMKPITGIWVGFFYNAPHNTLAGALFARIAPNAGSIPVTSYVEKFMKVLSRGAIISLSLVVTLMMGFLVFWSRRPFLDVASKFKDQTVVILKTRQVWFAALVLGFTTAIRVLGPFAGVIVLTYMVFRLRKKALPLILPYVVISSMFIYIFWPFLWKSPIENFLKTLILMSDNPSIINVLFNGALYPSSDLPATYLPILLTIQITESVVVLACVGIVFLFMRLGQKNYHLLLLIFSLWFLLPLVGVMVFRPALYDNFRQFLFIVPPFFLIAGMGLEFVFEHLKKASYRSLFLAALIIPAIYMNIKLHPFEYVYYNSFVGGTKGAFRRFEMDYWLTSYREAAEYLSQNEKKGAQVVNLPVDMSTFAENKLSLYEGKCTGQPLYAVISSRWNGDKTEYETAPIVHTIKYDDAVLMVIRELPCPPPPP